jgi:hypothetical protein
VGVRYPRVVIRFLVNRRVAAPQTVLRHDHWIGIDDEGSSFGHPPV